MSKRRAAVACLLLLALTLGGCSKCGWLWDKARACQSDTAPR